MRVQNPDKWSYFDDYNYDYYGRLFPLWYSSGIGLSIGFGTGFYSPYYGGFGYYSPMSYYNSYYAWNSFYNPYYGGVVIVNGKNTTTPSYTRMSNFNPSAYQRFLLQCKTHGSHQALQVLRSSQTYYNRIRTTATVIFQQVFRIAVLPIPRHPFSPFQFQQWRRWRRWYARRWFFAARQVIFER